MNSTDSSAPTTPPVPPPTGTAPANPNIAVVPAAKRDIRVVQDDSPIAYLMDTARFEHICRIAGMMARAGLIPKHLKGESFEQTQANCFLVVNQSLRWGFDPFSVAPSTYEVGGKLGFEGKLIAAVVNTRANLEGRLSYKFNDKPGDALEVTVSGTFKGETEPRIVTVTVAQARTDNKMWTKDPQQKLIYTGSIKWARRHCPEVVLGVFTDDDIESIREEARALAAKPAKVPDFGPDIKDPARIAAPVPEKETPKPPVGEKVDSVKATPEKAPVAPTEAQPDASATEFKANSHETEACNNIRFLMAKSGVSEPQLLAYCRAPENAIGDKAKITELSDAKLLNLGRAWNNILPKIKAFPL